MRAVARCGRTARRSAPQGVGPALASSGSNRTGWVWCNAASLRGIAGRAVSSSSRAWNLRGASGSAPTRLARKGGGVLGALLSLAGREQALLMPGTLGKGLGCVPGPIRRAPATTRREASAAPLHRRFAPAAPAVAAPPPSARMALRGAALPTGGSHEAPESVRSFADSPGLVRGNWSDGWNPSGARGATDLATSRCLGTEQQRSVHRS